MWLLIVQIFHGRCSLLLLFAVWVLCFILPLRSSRSAACLQPPKFVRMGVMYSATLPRFHLRAANFLSPGYSNCSISILHQPATGSAPPISLSQYLSYIWTNNSQNEFDNFCYLLFCRSKNILTAGSLHTFFILNENPFNSRHSVTELKGFFWMTSYRYRDNCVSRWSSSTEIPAAWWGI